MASTAIYAVTQYWSVQIPTHCLSHPDRLVARFGKPVAVTEFGCCTYRGAADRGGMGCMIVDDKSDTPLSLGTYERDEEEQVRHLHDMLAIYETEDLDSAFWHTFAQFEYHRHPRPAPRL
jgi:hypothetical protein